MLVHAYQSHTYICIRITCTCTICTFFDISLFLQYLSTYKHLNTLNMYHDIVYVYSHNIQWNLDKVNTLKMIFHLQRYQQSADLILC